MINDLVQRADFPVGNQLNGEIDHLEDKNPTAIARVISSAENFPEVAKPVLEAIYEKNKNSKTPVLGITGTGGAGKSSLVDELVRVTPSNMYLTKVSRTGNKFTFEGKAESPNTVAEFLRNLEASPWYRNAFMNSFLAKEENKDKAPSSVVPRVEESYGTFVVTSDLEEIAIPVTPTESNSTSAAGAAQ